MTSTPDPQCPPPGRRAQLIEVSVFLLLFLPAISLSFLAVLPADLDFTFVAVSIILEQIALMALVLFFVWRNGEGMGAIGLTRRNLWGEAGLGIALFFPFAAGVAIVEGLLRAIGLEGIEELPDYLVPKGGFQLALAFVFLVVVAVAEETVFRGYLLRRFTNLMANRVGAVVLSAAIFSIGHGYQGMAGVLTVGAAGMFFAIIYLWRGSLVAPMVIHFIQNFIGIILVPLLAHGE